jgi:hypothetical protein
VGAGFGLASQQKPTYTAFASYALVFYSDDAPSPSGPDPRERNPLASDRGVLLGEALAADFMSGPSQLEFGGTGNSGVAPGQANDNNSSYSVGLSKYSESLYLVQTWGKNPEDVRTVVDSILAAAPERAAMIQDRVGAPRDSQYTTFVTSPTQVVKLLPSRIKFLVAVLGVGILAGCGLSLVVDRLLRSRRDKRPPIKARETPPRSSEDLAVSPTSKTFRSKAGLPQRAETQRLKVPYQAPVESSIAAADEEHPHGQIGPPGEDERYDDLDRAGEITSDRMPEMWSLPPWTDWRFVDDPMRSGNGAAHAVETVENPTKTVQNPVLIAELVRQKQEAAPNHSKSNVVHDIWREAESALTITQAANGANHDSDAETRYQESMP